MSVTLAEALASHPELGTNYENLGKAESCLGAKAYLSYDPQAGWSVETFNIFWRVIRFFLSCLFTATHYSTVVSQLSHENNVPEELNNRMLNIWQENYPSVQPPNFLTSASPRRVKLAIETRDPSHTGVIGTDSSFSFHAHLTDAIGNPYPISPEDYYIPMNMTQLNGNESFVLKTERGMIVNYLPSTLFEGCEDDQVVIFRWRGELIHLNLPTGFKMSFEVVKEYAVMAGKQYLFPTVDRQQEVPQIKGYRLSSNAKVLSLVPRQQGQPCAAQEVDRSSLWLTKREKVVNSHKLLEDANGNYCFQVPVCGVGSPEQLQIVWDGSLLFIRSVSAKYEDRLLPKRLARLLELMVAKYQEVVGTPLEFQRSSDGNIIELNLNVELQKDRLEALRQYGETIFEKEIPIQASLKDLLFAMEIPLKQSQKGEYYSFQCPSSYLSDSTTACSGEKLPAIKVAEMLESMENKYQELLAAKSVVYHDKNGRIIELGPNHQLGLNHQLEDAQVEQLREHAEIISGKEIDIQPTNSFSDLLSAMGIPLRLSNQEQYSVRRSVFIFNNPIIKQANILSSQAIIEDGILHLFFPVD